MASPVAALYRIPEEAQSAKTRELSLLELKRLIYYSGAPHSVRRVTMDALEARGPWPNGDGPATTIICVSIIGMMIEGGACRRTVQRRVKRACKLGFWRLTRKANSWADCLKCGKPRETGKCEKCGYKGNAKDMREFARPFTYEFDVQRFVTAPRCREIHSIDWRTYKEYKEAAARGEHPNVTEMPRKPAQPTPPQNDPPPTKAAPASPKKVAEHRSTERAVTTEITDRTDRAAQLLIEMCGLPDEGIAPYIVSAIIAEARFAGLAIEDAAKVIADCVRRDQRAGVAISRFYFRDAKWRSNGGRPTSASSERSQRSKRNILNGLLSNARPPDAPDGPEREE
jgi:hypothetical protein